MQATKTPITCEEPTCSEDRPAVIAVRARAAGQSSCAASAIAPRRPFLSFVPSRGADARRKTHHDRAQVTEGTGTGTGAKLLRCAEHRARRQRELTRRRVQAHRELEGPIPRRICIGTIPQHPNIPWKLWDEPCGNFTTEEGERRRGPRPHYCKAHKALQRKLKFFAREERKYDREGKEKQRYRNHKREAVRNISRIRGIPLDAAKGYHEAYHRIGPRYSNYAISQATRYGFSPEQIDLIASYIAGYRFGRADRPHRRPIPRGTPPQSPSSRRSRCAATHQHSCHDPPDDRRATTESLARRTTRLHRRSQRRQTEMHAETASTSTSSRTRQGRQRDRELRPRLSLWEPAIIRPAPTGPIRRDSYSPPPSSPGSSFQGLVRRTGGDPGTPRGRIMPFFSMIS